MEPASSSPSQPTMSAAGWTDAEQQSLERFQSLLEQTSSLKAALRAQALRSRWWLAADAALVVFGLVTWRAVWIAAGVLAAAVPFVFTALGFRSADRYQRLLRHHALGHWETVRVLARELRSASANKPALDFDLDVRLAGIYARERSLDEALQRLQPWRERLAKEGGLFETRVASVHWMAGDTAGFVAQSAQAFAASSKDPARLLYHALAQARFGDLDQARALLQQLDDTAGVPPHAAPSVHWAHGLVQLRCRASEATATLARAVTDFLERAGHPESWPALALCTCDLAVALHQSGRHDAARRCVAAVWPVLEVHATVPLLRMLEADDLLPITGKPPRSA